MYLVLKALLFQYFIVRVSNIFKGGHFGLDHPGRNFFRKVLFYMTNLLLINNKVNNLGIGILITVWKDESPGYNKSNRVSTLKS